MPIFNRQFSFGFSKEYHFHICWYLGLWPCRSIALWISLCLVTTGRAYSFFRTWFCFVQSFYSFFFNKNQNNFWLHLFLKDMSLSVSFSHIILAFLDPPGLPRSSIFPIDMIKKFCSLEYNFYRLLVKHVYVRLTFWGFH